MKHLGESMSLALMDEEPTCFPFSLPVNMALIQKQASLGQSALQKQGQPEMDKTCISMCQPWLELASLHLFLGTKST